MLILEVYELMFERLSYRRYWVVYLNLLTHKDIWKYFKYPLLLNNNYTKYMPRSREFK